MAYSNIYCISFSRYNKTEYLKPGGPELMSFTHLIVEAKSKYSPNLKPYVKTHNIISIIDTFSHLQFSYLNYVNNVVSIKTKPILYILKRKDLIRASTPRPEAVEPTDAESRDRSESPASRTSSDRVVVSEPSQELDAASKSEHDQTEKSIEDSVRESIKERLKAGIKESLHQAKEKRRSKAEKEEIQERIVLPINMDEQSKGDFVGAKYEQEVCTNCNEKINEEIQVVKKQVESKANRPGEDKVNQPGEAKSNSIREDIKKKIMKLKLKEKLELKKVEGTVETESSDEYINIEDE